jgi:glycerol kinase
MRAMPAGLDLGSSSVKAVLVSRDGRAGAAARRGIATRRRPGGRVEHDAEDVLRAVLAALRAVLPGRAREPEPLGIATQRSTVLFWDRDSGRPLTPAYSWQDLRGEPLCNRLRRWSRSAGDGTGALGPGGDGDLDQMIVRRTGLRLSPHYSASKLAWALRRVRGLRRRVAAGKALWGTLGTFLTWRLSGGAAYTMDHANAQRTSLFDLATRSWDPELFELFDIGTLLDAPALPALTPTTLAAPVTLDRSGLPLRLLAMTGDQQAALLGLGCRAEGAIAISYGSGAFVLINTGPRLVRVRGLLSTLLASWREEGAGPEAAVRYALEGTVNAAATALDWAGRRLRLRVRTADLDRFLGPDDGRPRAVHFLPAVAGIGAPRWDPAARPRFSGNVRRAPASDLLRAVVESIACRCAEIVRAASAHLEAGTGPASDRPVARLDAAPVLAAGGLTRCRALLQAQADLLQRPVIVRESPDAGCLGAALLTQAPSAWWAAGRAARGRGVAGQRRAGDVIVRPRISKDEAEARYLAWEGAVYGLERARG